MVFSQMISQDINVAIKAFDSDEFELMNIYGNRIMADTLFSDNSKLALYGFFIKQVAIIYINLKGRLTESKFHEAKIIGKRYITTLFESFNNNVEENKLWSEFNDFNNRIREYIILDLEKDIYKENPDLTNLAFKWLVKYLYDNKELLCHPDNRLIKGILNEMNRIYNTYGGKLADTYILSLVIALDRYFDYCLHAFKKSLGDVEEEKIKSAVFPYVEEILKLSLSENIDPKYVTDILWKLIKGWREFFIQFMEISRATRELLIKRPIELPKELKERLGKVIEKALKKEAKL